MKKAISLFIVLCLTTAIIAQYQVYDSDLFLEKVNELGAEENYNEALIQLEYINRNDPNYLRAQKLKVEIYEAQEKYDDALDCLHKLKNEGKYNENLEFYVLEGSLLKSMDRLDESVNVFLEGEKKAPKYSHLLFNFALTYYAKKEIQKAIDYTKMAIEYNPNNSRAHYFLGVLAFEYGYIAEGSLALLAYIVNSPADDYTKQAALFLSQKMSQNYLEKGDYKFSSDGEDDFSKLEIILRNDLALNKDFKLKCDIDDIYTRHCQALVEYATIHKIGNGFFEKKYIPYLKEIAKQNETEAFIYYTMIGLEVESFSKKLNKKMDEIQAFYDGYYMNSFWNLFGKRELDLYGNKQEYVIYLNDQIPSSIDPVTGGKRNGKGMIVDQYGRNAGSVEYKNDKYHGPIKLISPEGKITEEANFLEGLKEGLQTYYNESGEIYATINWKEGEADGFYTSYYPNGTEQCKSNYKVGNYDKESYCNYEDGTRKFTITYNEGKISGTRINYHQDGTINSEENFANDLLDGVSKQYELNGDLYSELKYKEGKISDSYELFDILNLPVVQYKKQENNAIEKVYTNGELTYTYQYDKNENLTKIDFYQNGTLYHTKEYEDGNVKKVYTWDSKSKKLKRNKNKFVEVRDQNGILIYSKTFNKGVLNGKSTTYFPNGKVSYEDYYINGKQSGKAKKYHHFGDLEYECNLEDDKLHGLYKSYSDGVLYSEYFYKEGILHGPYSTYFPDGRLEKSGFFFAGELQGENIIYTSNGEIYSKSKYEGGKLEEIKYFKVGVEPLIEDRINSLDQFELPIYNGVSKNIFSTVNGVNHGTYMSIDRLDDTIYIGDFINGVKHGIQRYFKPSGNISHIGNVINGQYEGEAKYFDDLGNPRVTTNFHDDKEHGEEYRYNVEGRVITYNTNRNGQLHGPTHYFNPSGDTLATIIYKNNFVVSYQLIGEDAPSNIDSKRISISANYADGTKAIELIFNNMRLDESKKLYNRAGKLIYEDYRKDNKLNGVLKRYFNDGTLYNESTYVAGMLTGITTYYNKKGEKLISFQSDNDHYSGAYEIYENNLLKTTKIYKDNELFQIK